MVNQAFPSLSDIRKNIKIQNYIELMIHVFIGLSAKETIASTEDLWKAAIEKTSKAHPERYRVLITNLGAFITPVVLDPSPENPIWKNAS